MNFSNYRFQPPWWATLLTLLGVLLFVKLSLWQWHRYQVKKTLQESYVAEVHSPAIPFPHSMPVKPPGFSSPPTLLYQHVKLQGHYDTRQFLLDNRVQNNQVGFDVITPLTLNAGGTILVNRGFVPANASREIFSDITPPAAPVSIEGFLTTPEKSFVLGSVIEPAQTHWPLKVMRIEPALFSQVLQTKTLLPYVILLSPQSPTGFVRQWSTPNLWAERSLGYCFQWLAFALLAITLYMVMNFRRVD